MRLCRSSPGSSRRRASRRPASPASPTATGCARRSARSRTASSRCGRWTSSSPRGSSTPPTSACRSTTSSSGWPGSGTRRGRSARRFSRPGAGHTGAMLHRDVADGIHRVEDAYTNWYLVENDGALTVVDAGVPTSWRSFLDAVRELGRKPSDVEAIVLTHGHFDHIGFAEQARKELSVPVWVHTNDVPLTRHPSQYAHDRPRDALPADAAAGAAGDRVLRAQPGVLAGADLPRQPLRERLARRARLAEGRLHTGAHPRP